jgi:GT2 family glycosyltransferase
MADPIVSVVIATCNRAELLPQTVAALDAQQGVGPYEIVIVDDASTDRTAAVLTELAPRDDVVVISMAENRGAAAARNKGWRAARAPIVAFTDDDCRPQPGWLATLVAGIGDADLVQGRTLPDPAQAANRGPFSRTMQVEFEEGYYETCNVAYRREVLERLQGFDEAFRLPYGEDTDMAWRARKAGARTAFAPDALVFHEVWPSRYKDHLRDMRRRGGLVLLFSKHPELRAHLRKRLFFRPLHQQALLAAVGTAAIALRPSSGPRWVVGGGLGLFYAYTCRRYRPAPPNRRGWLTVVPLSLVADLYDVAVMARASVRYRTLLL